LVDGIVACGAPDALAAAVGAGHRIIIVLHLPISDELGLAPRQRDRYIALEARALEVASGVMCPSYWSAAEVSRRYGLRDVGVAVPGVTPAAVAQGSRHTGLPRILTLATLTPTKDQLSLVQALAQVSDLAWTAALVGSDQADPDYAARLRAEIVAAGLGERIAVPGLLVGKALGREWDATDLLVLPSRIESYGLVIGEALARGIPAVVTAGTGAVEALEQRATIAAGASSDPPSGATPGAVIPARDPASLAGILRSWLSEPTVRRAWRQAAVVRRDTLPGWQQTAAAVLEYLERRWNLWSTRAGSPPA
jgi:glycosyltransferase involved in cell wall biosynthesis